jgi:DHA3 family tetracycline resistance protein-like MFS transporter
LLFPRLHAYPAYLLLQAANSFAFALLVTVNLVYQVEVAHLNPLQLVLVGTMLEGTAFVLEVPTGIVADVYSRRLAIIVGTAFLGLGSLVQAIPRLEALLLSSLLWGVGFTFSSGAEEAWIADEIGPERAGHAYVRGAQVGQLAGVAGIVASVTLASIQLALPIVLSGCMTLLIALGLALLMPEDGFHRAPRTETSEATRRGSWRAMGATARHGLGLLRWRPVLITILGIAAFFGMSSEGFDRLAPDHFLTDFRLPALGTLNPIYWFGIMSIGGMLLSIVGNEVVRRRVDTTSHRAVTRTLLAIETVMIACLLAFALARSFALALAAFWAIGVLRATTGPLKTAWINQSVDSRARATIHSLTSQADACGQIAGGPVVGWIGTVRSLRAALATAALVLVPTLPLFARALGQGEDQGGDQGRGQGGTEPALVTED